jgi:hypothetical protein
VLTNLREARSSAGTRTETADPARNLPHRIEWLTDMTTTTACDLTGAGCCSRARRHNATYEYAQSAALANQLYHVTISSFTKCGRL